MNTLSSPIRVPVLTVTWAIRRLFAPTPLKRSLFYLTVDLLAVVSATAVVHAFTGYDLRYLVGGAFVALLLQFSINFLLGAYRLKWSTWSLVDAPRAIAGSLIAGACGVGLTWICQESMLALALVAGTLVNLALIGLLRSSKRLLHDLRLNRGQIRRLPLNCADRNTLRRKRAALVVSSEQSYFLLDALRQSAGDEYEFVGFIDPQSANQGAMSQGLPILGSLAEVEEIVHRHSIETVIVSLSSESGRIPRDSSTSSLAQPTNLSLFYERVYKLGTVEVRTIPALADFLAGPTGGTAAEQRIVHELTGLPPLAVDFVEMASYFGNKRVLVTGAGGSIGTELCHQLGCFRPAELVLFERDDSNLFQVERQLRFVYPRLRLVPYLGDITRQRDVVNVFRAHKPEIVFHAAAYKHVPILEYHPAEAIRVNVVGAHIVACQAVKHGTKTFVYISTDKAVNPTSVMGASKRFGEMVITSMNGLGDVRFLAVRFGNVLDSRGSVTTIFRDAIVRRQPVTITHPAMRRYFMLPSEAVLLVMQAAILSGYPTARGGEVFVLDMGRPVRILDLARTMIRQAGLRPDIDIPIITTGLRPGEKLFEELLTAEEGTVATSNQRILRARISHNYSYPEMLRYLQQLERIIAAAPSVDREEIVNLLRRIVPTYTPDARVSNTPPTASQGLASSRQQKPAGGSLWPSPEPVAP